MEEQLIALACMAGDAIREVYERGNWEITLKSDRSPLTEADRASHSILCDGLKKVAPGIPILSEEAEQVPYEIRKDWHSYFLIDPLDGTREFVKKVPEFAINIAWIEENRPVLGVTHNPLKRITYFAERGKGAYKWTENRARLPISTDRSFPVKVLLSHTDQTPELEPLLNKISEHSIRRMGSSLKFCYVAEGMADFYPRLKPSMEWDTASGTILVEESGGIVCGLDGLRIEYNRQNMLNPPFFVIGPSMLQKMTDWQEILF